MENRYFWFFILHTKRILNFERKTIEFGGFLLNSLYMENISNTKNTHTITEEEIFSKIWLQPRKVFRFIEDNKFENHLFIIYPVLGIINALNKAADRNMGDTI